MNILMIDENALFYVSPPGLEKFPKIEGKESLNSRYLIKRWIDFYNNYNASFDLRLIPNFASLYHLVGRVLKTTGKFMRVNSQEEVLKILKKQSKNISLEIFNIDMHHDQENGELYKSWANPSVIKKELPNVTSYKYTWFFTSTARDLDGFVEKSPDFKAKYKCSAVNFEDFFSDTSLYKKFDLVVFSASEHSVPSNYWEVFASMYKVFCIGEI